MSLARKLQLSVLLGLFLFQSITNAQTLEKFTTDLVWNIYQGPLELSGICHIATNEYACVSDSGGKVYSFFLDDKNLSTDFMPTKESFRLIRQGIGHDLEACFYVDDAILCIDEATSSVKRFKYGSDSPVATIQLPIKNIVSNCGLESLAYSKKDKVFITCTEQPVKGAESRIIKMLLFKIDTETNRCIKEHEFQYQIDQFDGKKVYRNGISELVVWDDETLLVIERAVDLEGTIPFSRICIYAVDWAAIRATPSNQSVAKRLVYESASKFFPMNIEGACRIPGTNKLLILHDLPSICFMGTLEGIISK